VLESAMSALEEEYLTVAEAAAHMRVAPSTIRRWIRQGDVPAYRIGRRRVALRRADLSGLIAPARPDPEPVRVATDGTNYKLTPEQKERSLAALERARQQRREILARRGGVPFRSSEEIIHEMRDERDRQLMAAMG
jgi:excisionase family DNA binding protein